MTAYEEAIARAKEGYHRPLGEVIEKVQKVYDGWDNVRNWFGAWDIEDVLFYLREYQSRNEG